MSDQKAVQLRQETAMISNSSEAMKKLNSARARLGQQEMIGNVVRAVDGGGWYFYIQRLKYYLMGTQFKVQFFTLQNFLLYTIFFLSSVLPELVLNYSPNTFQWIIERKYALCRLAERIS